MRSPGLKSRVMSLGGRGRGVPKPRGDEAVRAAERCGSADEPRLPRRRAGEDASGCPDGPAGAVGAEAAVAGRPPPPASTQATCATSCRRGVSTAKNRNRRHHCRRRRCAAPARLPLGAR
ncbi:uncharacterized protein LOC144377288 [Ictidomys tridecemlineatus]